MRRLHGRSPHDRLKDPREAAGRLGIPEIVDRREELGAVMAPPEEAVEAAWAATRALWDHAMGAAAQRRVESKYSLPVLCKSIRSALTIAGPVHASECRP